MLHPMYVYKLFLLMFCCLV